MGKRLIITESEKREILGLYKKNIFEQSVETQAAISKLDPNVFNATVLDIQVKLNKKNVSTPGWVALKEDGKYGTNTKKALSDYLIAKKASPSTTSYTVKTATGNIVMDATQLQDAISKGEIKSDTKVWKEGMPTWITAGTAEDLKSMRMLETAMKYASITEDRVNFKVSEYLSYELFDYIIHRYNAGLYLSVEIEVSNIFKNLILEK